MVLWLSPEQKGHLNMRGSSSVTPGEGLIYSELAGARPERRAEMHEQETKNQEGLALRIITQLQGFGFPMNCGRFCSHSFPSLSTLIVLAGDARAYPIDSVRMRFSTSYELAANGKPWTRRSYARIRQHTTAFKNGSRQACSSNSGKPESNNLMSYVGSTGTGSQWMGP